MKIASRVAAPAELGSICQKVTHADPAKQYFAKSASRNRLSCAPAAKINLQNCTK